MPSLRTILTADTPFSRAYKRLFSLREVETDIALKWFAGALIFAYFAHFNMWIADSSITVETYRAGIASCWPFFQSCDHYYWLSNLPNGYSQTIVYMLLFGVMAFGAWAMHAGRWAWVHASILVLFLFRLYVMAFTYTYKSNYDYYHVIFSLIFLLLPHKRFFAQLAIVALYSNSTIAKIYPSWTLGSYFSSMKDGLPIFNIFGKGTEPYFTNAVIFMEMVMSWFLFSSRAWLQRAVLGFFIFFHLYSGTLVYYLYPATVLPPLIILFGPWFKPYKEVPLTRASIPGWLLITLILASPLVPRLIPGDEKLTMEGNYYSLYMFEANHQCAITLSLGNHPAFYQQSYNPRFRCDPYEFLIPLQRRYCQRTHSQLPYHFVMDHSINGGPFYRIVDEPDLCALTYKPFSHNNWIHDQSTAPIVGRALENAYR